MLVSLKQRLLLVSETSVKGFLTCFNETKKYYVDISLSKSTQTLGSPDLLRAVLIVDGTKRVKRLLLCTNIRVPYVSCVSEH